jgi:putative ABC transport system permease protein
MSTVDIPLPGLLLGYTLILIPLSVMLWLRLPLIGRTVLALLRMTVQLFFVGFYLQVVFEVNNVWLNGAWVLVMIGVADLSIVRGCDLRLARFAAPLFLSLLVGTALPLFFLLGPVLMRPNLLDAQYAIPIGGMILGNCLRADIICLRFFYESIRKNEKSYLLALAQGASLTEACRPFLRDAFQAALAPTVATMATIGLVALPGMMTGVILGGADPLVAIEYQILIMIAIFTGTTITIALAIRLTLRGSFTRYGILDLEIFRGSKGKGAEAAATRFRSLFRKGTE